MTGNWFKVSREIFSHPIADDKPWDRLSAWLYLISLAAHDNYTTIIRQHEYPLMRGQLAISMTDFAEKTGWTKEKVRMFLAWLRRHGMIQLYSDHASTFVKIVNYDKWQGTQSNTLDNTENDTENNTADGFVEQTEEGVSNIADNIAHNTANNTPSEESPPCILLKKEGRRSSTKEPPTPKKSKPNYSATMNYETGRFEITAEALAKLDQDHPTVELEAEIKNAEGWCLDTAKKHKIVNGMSFLGKWMTKPTCKQRDTVTRFNSGALKGQIYRVNHANGRVQANKRPEPICDLKKLGIKGTE